MPGAGANHAGVESIYPARWSDAGSVHVGSDEVPYHQAGELVIRAAARFDVPGAGANRVRVKSICPEREPITRG
eukprot:2011806-Pyramimonas_sp.AAC.1